MLKIFSQKIPPQKSFFIFYHTQNKKTTYIFIIIDIFLSRLEKIERIVFMAGTIEDVEKKREELNG